MKKYAMLLIIVLMIALSGCSKNEAPTLEFGDKEITVELGATFQLPDCDGIDPEDGNLSCAISGDTVNTGIAGVYTVIYSTTDSEGIEVSDSFVVTVVDTTTPTITIDNSQIVLEVDDSFTSPVCTVSDNGETTTCTEDKSSLDTSKLGSYIVSYYATDEAGNKSTTVDIVVIVQDTTSPNISLSTDSLVIEYGESVTYPTCSVNDNYDDNLTCTIDDSNLDINTLGVYNIIYSVADSSGNVAALKTFEVTVMSTDTVAPIIEVEYTDYTILKDVTFNGIECSVTDDTVDSCTLEGIVDTSTVGDYSIVYSAVDISGLRSEVVVTVHVVDEDLVIYENVAFNLRTGEVLEYLFTTGNDIIIPDEIYDVPVTELSCMISDYQTTYVNSVSIGGQITEFNECFDNVIVAYDDITITGSNPDAYEDRWADTQLPYPLYGYYYFDEYYGQITGYIGSESMITVPSMINGVTVTSIGERAFGDDINFDTITIPGNVVSIEAEAFASANFKYYIFEEGVQTIGASVFRSYNIVSITIPQSVTDIGLYCFSSTDIDKINFVGGYERFYGDWLDIGLDIEDLPESAYILQDGLYFVPTANKIIKADVGLDPITVPATINSTPVLELGRYVFANYAHTTITLEEGLLIIGESAFISSELESITIPASVITIGIDSFKYTNSLDTVTILGESTRFDDVYDSIGLFRAETFTEGAFTYSSTGNIIDYDAEIGGYDVVIPEYLGGVKIEYLNSYLAFKDKDILSISLPEGLLEIGSGVFSNTLITELVIPASVESIGYNIFSNSDLVTVTLIGDPINFYGSDFYEDYIIVESNGLFFDERLHKITGYDYTIISNDLVIPNQINGIDVLYIGIEAFEDAGLTSLILPEGLLGIGQEAFAENLLETIILPSTLNYVGIGAFNDNDISGTLVIPEGLEVIQQLAFYYNSLVEVVLPVDFQFINGGVFGHNDITTINLPNTIKIIGKSALSRNELSGILVLPTDLIWIDDNAFGSNEFTEITFNEKLEYIGESAFRGNMITSLVVPNTVTYIGKEAFIDNMIETLVLPTNLTAIQDSTFKNNVITAIIIPNTVIEIAASAFENNLIEEITCPEGLVIIGQEAFRNNEISGVWLSDSVMIIGDGAFAENIVPIGFGGNDIAIARFSGEIDRITAVPVN